MILRFILGIWKLQRGVLILGFRVCQDGSAHRGYYSSQLLSKQLQHICIQHVLCDTRASALRDRHPKLLGESEDPSNRSFCPLKPSPLFLMQNSVVVVTV